MIRRLAVALQFLVIFDDVEALCIYFEIWHKNFFMSFMNAFIFTFVFCLS